jgi:hypothetical protein
VYAHFGLCADDLPSLGGVHGVAERRAGNVFPVRFGDVVAVFGVWGALGGEGGGRGWEDGEKGCGDCGKGCGWSDCVVGVVREEGRNVNIGGVKGPGKGRGK